jgi:MFS family permease
VYLGGSGLTALTLNSSGPWLVFLYLTRFIAGMGIGGEYAAINSAIDELIPARYRGRVDLLVNGTYWFGAIIGTLGTYVFLNLLEPSLGWRLGFAIGPVLGLVIIYVRRHLPESPRWQVMHGQTREAEQTIGYIEEQVRQSGRDLPPVDESKAIEVKAGDDHGWVALARILFRTYPTRSILGVSMMITQSFLYNAIFFTYTLVLARFYGVPSTDTPIYFIAFAAGNFLGPLLLGPLFDTWGRKQMISLTYITSGVLLAITAVLFNAGLLTAVTQTLAWSVIFFFASAGASSAYLTVSEIFPMEVRAKAIALFFAIAQCFGALGPVIYGALIGNGEDPTRLFWGYLPGGAVMVLGGIVALVYGVAAERRSLEDIATPLNAVVPASRSGSAPAEGGGSPRSF